MTIGTGIDVCDLGKQTWGAAFNLELFIKSPVWHRVNDPKIELSCCGGAFRNIVSAGEASLSH